MKLNESFVKRLMTLAGNSDYSSRFINEKKKVEAKKKDKKKKEEVLEAEDDDRELLSDEDDMDSDDMGEMGEEEEDYEGEDLEDSEHEGSESEAEEAAEHSGFDFEDMGASDDDEMGDEGELDLEDEGGGQTEVTIDARKLVSAVTDALASVLGSDVVSMESSNDNEMEDEGEFDLEDEGEEELPKSLGESRNVTKMISKTIAESVFNKLVARGILEAKDPDPKKKIRSLTSSAKFTEKEAERYNELMNDPKFKEYLKSKNVKVPRETAHKAPPRGNFHDDPTAESKYSGMKKKVKKPVEDSYQMKKVKGIYKGEESED